MRRKGERTFELDSEQVGIERDSRDLFSAVDVRLATEDGDGEGGSMERKGGSNLSPSS